MNTRAIVAALLAVALFAGGWLANGWRKDVEISRMKAAIATAQAKAIEAARAEEQRRTAAQTEIANAATKDAERARQDARTAAATSDGLRKRVAELIAAARNPATPASGQAAGDPLDVLADVLSRADKTAGDLAEYADQARIAGHACERAYDSLTEKP